MARISHELGLDQAAMANLKLKDRPPPSPRTLSFITDNVDIILRVGAKPGPSQDAALVFTPIDRLTTQPKPDRATRHPRINVSDSSEKVCAARHKSCVKSQSVKQVRFVRPQAAFQLKPSRTCVWQLESSLRHETRTEYSKSSQADGSSV